MASALAALQLRISYPQRLLLASAAAYTVVFALVLAYGRPGLGVSQGFYLAIVLAALATGAPQGAAAGAAALLLYEAAELLAGRRGWDGLLQPETGVRLAAYVLAGATVGSFARRARRLLADSFHVLDELLEIARRDVTTGLRSPSALEAEIAAGVAVRRPFGVVVAALAGTTRASDRSVQAARLAAALGPEDEVAYLGSERYAAVAGVVTADGARARAGELERQLAAHGIEASAGWAFYPADGTDALALVSAAVERLQERRIVRGEWRPTPESAGLVARLRRS